MESPSAAAAVTVNEAATFHPGNICHADRSVRGLRAFLYSSGPLQAEAQSNKE